MCPESEILSSRQTVTIEHSIKIGKDTFMMRNRTRTDFITDPAFLGKGPKTVCHTFSRESILINNDAEFYLVHQWINGEPLCSIHPKYPSKSKRNKLKCFIRAWKPILQLSEALEIGGEPMQLKRKEDFEDVLINAAGCKRKSKGPLQLRSQLSRFASNAKDPGLLEKSEKHVLAKKLLSYIDKQPEQPQFRLIQDLQESLRNVVLEMDELEKMAEDAELQQLAQQDLEKLVISLDDLLADASRLLLPGRNFDSNNSLLEVHAGAGGGEASVFAQQIFQMYLRYAGYLGFTINKIETEVPPGVNVGIQKASASIVGRDVFRSLKYECGVHRVQRIPLAGTKNDRLQTSTCSVAVLPELSDDADFNIPDSDLKIETMRSSGAGGQNVNVNDTAVRILHIPTGLSIKSQEQRSQNLNRKYALAKLKSELYRRKFEQEIATINKSRQTQIGNMNRNEKIRTYNYSRNTISDHRLGKIKQVPCINSFIEGSLGFDVLDLFKEQLQATEDFESLKILLDSKSSPF